MNKQPNRELTFSILKHSPCDKNSKPKFHTYKIQESHGMTLFIALNKIREELDHDLSFDFVCRAGICGSCGMIANGKPSLACKTLTSSFTSGNIQLIPMPTFELIKDLSVNTGKWMHNMNKRVESWIHSNTDKNICEIEDKVEPQEAQEVFELDRCIECGICVSACGTALMREDFIGAVGLNRVARFKIDSKDKRNDDDFYEIVGNDDGVFGCMSLMGCDDFCPKNLPLQSKIAYLRRAMISN